MPEFVHEPARKTPIFGTWDVVVVGGGMAGVAAALTAARQGVRVCLVEKENALGGLATLGNVLIYLPLCDGRGNQVVGGLGEELLHVSLKYGPGQVPSCWQEGGHLKERRQQRYLVEFNPASFMLALEELLLTAGVHLMYDTRFCDVLHQNSQIEAPIVENKSGRGALRSKVVVDASGDADVCARAGERTVSLRTNRKSGWYLSYNEGRVSLHMLHDSLGPLPPETVTYAGDRWYDVTAMNVQGRRLVRAHMASMAAEKGYHKAYPLVLPTLPLFRMTRRLQGRYTLQQDDVKQVFPDAIGMVGDWRKAGPIYCIPFACLVGESITNLIVAGRCISVSQEVWDVTRAIPACVVTGEAAGVAAAMAVGSGHAFAALDVPELQNRLLEQGVILRKDLMSQG